MDRGSDQEERCGSRLSGGRASHAIAALGLVLCAVVAFHGMMPEELVLDAVTLIRDNPRLAPDRPWGELRTTGYWGDFSSAGLWRPLTLTLFRVERNGLGFGDTPLGYVVVNLVLHILVVLGLWWVALRVGCGPWGAFWAAAVFAVHPIATEIVPNVVGLADLVVALVTVTMLLAWRRVVTTASPVWFSAFLIAWLAALLAKESAVVIPAVVLLVDLVLNREPTARDPIRWARQRAVPVIALVVLGVAWLAVRHLVLARSGEPFLSALNNPLVLETPLVRAANGLTLIGSYLAQWLWPARLCADYSHATIRLVRTAADPRLMGTAVALFLLGAAAWRCRTQCPAVSVGLGLFALAILPVSNLLFPIGTIRGDRLGYVPALGLALAAGAALDHLTSRLRPGWSRTVRAGLLVLPVAALLPMTIHCTHDWRSNLALWRATVAAAPDNVKARHNLARNLLDLPDPDVDGALRHLEVAVALSRDLPGDEFFEPLLNLGTLCLRKAAAEAAGDELTSGSRRWLERAVEAFAEGERRTRHHGRRWASFEAAVERQASRDRPRPQFGDARINLGLAVSLDALGQSDQARPQLQRAIEVDPTNPLPYLRLALIYARQGEVGYVRTLVGLAARLPSRGPEDRLLLAQLVAILQRGTGPADGKDDARAIVTP